MGETVGLEDLAWLRRLARRLVRDSGLADDAVQETLIAAGVSGRASRAWLARVFRSKVRQEQRGRARRAGREERHSAAKARHAPAPDDLLAELELHGLLLENVRALKEPYRETILLRFVREWSPGRIARHQEVPVKTVHTRIDRGLGQLRARLDHTAPREEWLAGLALLTEPRPLVPLAVTGAGAVAMSIPPTLKVALVVAVAALVGVPLLLETEDDAEPTEVATVTRRAVDDTAAPVPIAGKGPAARRASAAGATSLERKSSGEPSAEDPDTAMVEGSVVDLDGAPVSGVTVVFEPRRGTEFAFDASLEGPRGRSDAEGRFTISPPEERGRLNVVGDTWVAMHKPNLGPERRENGPMLIVCPRRSYGGTVRDEDGAPVADASVRISLPGDFLEPIAIADRVVPLSLPLAETTTDDRGAFLFDAVGHFDTAFVEAARDDFVPAVRPLPELTSLDISLELERRPAPERSIQGRVTSRLGIPVAGARVSVGNRSVASDEAGRFVLEIEEWRDDAVVRAADRERGFCIEHLDPASLEEALDGEALDLQLGGPAVSLVGRVVRPNGDPVPKARVWTPDTTFFGSAPVQAERAMTAMATTEALAAGGPGPYSWVQVTTADATGRFELRGLMPRAYDVFAADPRTLEVSEATRLVPGSDSRTLVLPEQSTFPVAGQVVNADGAPMAGLRITPGRIVDWERPKRLVDFWHGSPLRAPRASVHSGDHYAITDEEGRFAFEGLVLEGATLTVRGDEVFAPANARVELDEVDDPQNVLIEVRELAELRLTCRADADRFAVRTRQDAYQPMFIPVEERVISAPDADIVDGRSVPVITGAGPATIVLMRGEEELERHDVDLVGGSQTIEL